jgi:isocitrate/isopropylmalate dehydrogenase
MGINCRVLQVFFARACGAPVRLRRARRADPLRRLWSAGMAEAVKIVVLEGDQTGQELLDQAVRLLDPELLSLELELERFDLSLENRRATANQVVTDAAGAMREAGLGLKAATITPEGADDVGSPNRILREEVDGKVIVRTGRRLPGVQPIAGVHYPISVVRMAVDDAYGAKQWREGDAGDPSEIAYRTEKITRSTCRAVAEYSFRTAEKMNARVYGGPKWTVSPVYEGMLKEELDQAAIRHPDTAYEPVLIDATYAGLLSGATDTPLVIPALNRDGDCLSDLVLPMFGSIAGAESVLLAFNDEYETTVAMAEAPHGTAPALEGKDVANPLAMILACGALLRHAADRHGAAADRASRAVYEAALETIASGVKTPDLGGAAGTTEFTTEVVQRVATKIEVWSSLGSAA